jgi:hemerythrin-like domain-containing protein
MGKFMGIATGIKKTTRSIEKAITGEEPPVDLLDTLKTEHEEVAALLQKLVKSERAVERKSLLKQIKAALVPHVRAEEKVLYDAIIAIRKKGVEKDGEEGYLEHGLADKMLATLGKINNAMSPEFSAASKVLKELVEHHVEEEEDVVWSDAKKNFSSDERHAMNERYLKLKKSVKIPA